ncbi:uncharacterized protein DNG_04935 [Cephalotrichum gorgonifer]|uniref:Uncharacterized protein n=1 Tax=Cephalotrichum gorgonifer TaxID=2041049 RepID=A0AAE8MZZ4_9PEZI|nr:uncharacterized protein DNG_04935 [Cephalotrichum gorgonifer]
MTDPDKSLLDRLRALKPATNVSLAGPQPPPPHLTTTPLNPTAINDVLADRLRSLRREAEKAPAAKPPTNHHLSAPANAPALPRHDPTTDPPNASPSSNVVPPHPTAFDEVLLETDDGFLEDLLRGEAASSDPALLDARAELDTLRDLAKQFSDLAAETRGAPGEDDGDDSDGEGMRRDVEGILSEAIAGAKAHEVEVGDDTTTPGGGGPDSTDAKVDDPAQGDGRSSSPFTLPSVPTDLPSPTTSPPQNVPSTGDFESDMARRMAALRTFTPAAAAAEAEAEDSNPLGLPSAPTFHPSDRSPTQSPAARPAGRAGFTDDDMKTWCVVCIEDGTLICPGCDDDVYCSRCWYEMHLGPAAGFDERSHKAQQFNKDKKKKVAIGA